MKPSILVGGQAVIEGVMMRVPGAYATAVRDSKGKIHILKIKLSASSDSIFFRILKKPGLWLQNITTKQPEDDMVEVSITALKEAFGDQYNTMIGKEYTAEAIG